MPSAAEHRDAAAQLLEDVNDCPENPGAARVLTQAAIAHALLGLLEIQLALLSRPQTVITTERN